MHSVPIADEERRLLDSYYSPVSGFTGYYVPFRASGRKKRWVNSRYPDTTLQRIRTDKFNDVLLHEHQTNNWGWRPNYVEQLLEHLSGERIPSLALAAWLYRNVNFESPLDAWDLVHRLFDDFAITSLETQLFQLPPTTSVSVVTSPHPAEWRELRSLIGSPPGYPPDEGGTLGLLQMRRVGPASE